ncbi:carbohydrate-binding family 9-like protein [bacterium]|nr:carbohydrate-binding family 9-like protein [bacterium]
MRMYPSHVIAHALVLVSVLVASAPAAGAFPRPSIAFEPRQYGCPAVSVPPVIDGSLEDPAWSGAPWSDPFVDIEGPARPAPTFATRVKMIWDDRFFYVGAELEEPHLWATLRERDAVIYHDNDFEVFIDPDGDNHLYYELEINALGTEWDLLLVKPYRDGAPAVNAWDIQGLRTAVRLEGTLNEPGDTDEGWSVEIAIPWTVLAECAGRPAPPRPGDIWRVNFSRVQWDLEVEDGAYAKRLAAGGGPLPEHNWVWSPQGLIAMHYPEMWGEVMFMAGGEAGPFDDSPEHLSITDAQTLMPLYYAQREHHERHGRFAGSLGELIALDPGLASLDDHPRTRLRLAGGNDLFHAILSTAAGIFTIDQTGRLERAPLEGVPGPAGESGVRP